MNKIILSLLIIILVFGAAVGATRAYFSDTVASTANAFLAGTLDLNVNGDDVDVPVFDIADIKPGDSQTAAWQVHNNGSIDGFLDIHNINQIQEGGTSTDAELAADPGNTGNLGTLLNAQLFVDNNTNNVYDAGDTLIYSGALDSLASDYDQNVSLGAGVTKNVAMIVSWPTGNPDTTDNAGQGDTAQLDMTFELGQTTAQ